MKALVLDFDGVLADSSRETFVVACRAWAEMEPESSLVRRLPVQAPAEELADLDLERIPEYHEFERLGPLGNRAEDFGVALDAIESGLEISSQEAYDGFFAEHDEGWLEEFHRGFYRQRGRLRKENPKVWVELQPAFQPVVDLILDPPAKVKVAIATAKDGETVRTLLKHWGLSRRIPARRVLDKEAGRSKREHLDALRRELDLPFGEMTFVDDKVNHLESVAPLGVRPVLAGWGFNGEREHDRARTLGYPIASLDTLAPVLFESSGS